MTWTDARISQLTRLWTEGVSAAGIAEALGDVSRSAVLGKLYRLQLLGSRKPASAPGRYQGPAAVAAVTSPAAAAPPVRGTPRPAGPTGRPGAAPPDPPRSPWREAAFAALPGTTPRPWLSREFGECAFPVGGDGDALISCCAAAKPRSAYCPAHHRLVFKPVAPAARALEQTRWTLAAERWAA